MKVTIEIDEDIVASIRDGYERGDADTLWDVVRDALPEPLEQNRWYLDEEDDWFYYLHTDDKGVHYGFWRAGGGACHPHMTTETLTAPDPAITEPKFLP